MRQDPEVICEWKLLRQVVLETIYIQSNANVKLAHKNNLLQAFPLSAMPWVLK